MQRRPENQKTPTVVVRKIREAILDEVFLPSDWLPELDLAKRFRVSRSPIREALLSLEKEGTFVTEARKGARVKPLSAKEAKIDEALVAFKKIYFEIVQRVIAYQEAELFLEISGVYSFWFPKTAN